MRNPRGLLADGQPLKTLVLSPREMKRDILAYYSDPNSPIITKKNAKAWKRVQDELATLQGMPVVPIK